MNLMQKFYAHQMARSSDFGGAMLNELRKKKAEIDRRTRVIRIAGKYKAPAWYSV